MFGVIGPYVLVDKLTMPEKLPRLVIVIVDVFDEPSAIVRLAG
jgi:hypothetical protein